MAIAPSNPDETPGDKVRAAIPAGKVPNRRRDRTWVGPGVGAECTMCGAAVNHDEIEFEIEFIPDGPGRRRETFRLHSRCFALWDSERKRADGAGRNSAA